MSDDKDRPGGAADDWVDPERRRPDNAFDKNDESYGQQYTRKREAEEGASDPSGNVSGRGGAKPGSAAVGEGSFAGTADGED